ncbi:calcium-binding protein [Streptomyces sp. R41]|uniref:Calcium-binding protein n=1 Tax=Streptomyces sp. R41 TaxID=3238632 RepID=A0AB39RQ80_9ACTN
MPMPSSRRAHRRRSLMSRVGLAFAAALALVVALPSSALAAPGDLDTSFGSGGKVTIDGGSPADGQDVVAQPDGKIVTVGARQNPETFYSDFSVMRHNADGSIDASFGGGDGEVLTNFEDGEDRAQGVTLQPDGKIVVVGTTERFGEENGGCCWLTVARYNPDGSVDTTFGDGGHVIPELAGGAEDGWAVAVLPGPEGKILAAGTAGGDFAAVRYDTHGVLDPTFDGDGKVLTPFPEAGNGGATAYDMALQPNGKFVLAGYSGETSFDFALARYNADGSLDTSFGGGDGRVTTDLGGYNWGRTVVVQSTGKVVVSGSSGGNFTLVRYNVDGSLDGGFGTGGVVTTAFGTGSAVRDLLLQPGDRIVAAGTAGNDFALASYNADGTLDTGFGSNGKTTTDFGTGDFVNRLALQSDGKILAFGNSGDHRALARYLGGTGTPPPPPPSGVDLSVTKAGPTTVSIGDRATYTMTVNNSTTATANGVFLSDTLAGPAASVVSATPSQGTCTTTATSADCSLGTLAPGAHPTVTIVVEPRATGTLTDTATLSATQTDPNPANNTATRTTTVNNSRGCTIIGTSGNDTLNGTFGNDVICALGGDDNVNASYGNDTVYGGYGNDRLDGGYGNDTLNGGPGNDNLIGNYGTDNLNTVDNISGNDTANGGPNTDTCTTDTGDTRISCP